MDRFNLATFALDVYSAGDINDVWFVVEATFSEHNGHRSVELGGTSETRTVGIRSVEMDTPTEARWTGINGTTFRARPVRPYDAVAFRLSPHPQPVEVVGAALVGADQGDVPRGPSSSRLALDVDKVWWAEDEQREHARDVALAVAHDLLGEATIPGWRSHVGATHLGWAPTKVPVRGADVIWSNARFVTPTVAELLDQGERHRFRREHTVSRSLIAAKWHAAADLDELTRIVWDHRFAIVLTTLEEQQRIDTIGSKTGGAERYIKAGIFRVYDRLHERDVDVELIDPSHPRHSELE
jgi:hypothetical protein